MSQSLHPMLNIAIKAARAAGAIINRGSQDLDLLKISSKGPNDFVSEVDHAAEAAIIEILLEAYPGHGILAEESGRDYGAKHSDYVWIIDPLDGTTNFLHGLPIYAVSIALAYRGKVEQAVVYDPNRNDLFYASKGRGAFLNDRRLRVSKRVRLADSLVGTGFPFRRGDNFQRYLKMFESVMQNCAGLRRPGSAALDLCYLAAGWYDGFFETGLSPWDVAAGSLMITEAGGLVGNFTGEADFLYQRELVAGNPKVYGQLVTLLAPYTRAISRDEEDGAEGETAATAAATTEGPADALAAALGGASTGASAGATPADGEAVTAAAPVRERKPVRIRKAEVADAAADGEAVDATGSEQAAPAAERPPRPAPTVSRKPPESRDPRDSRGPRTGDRGDRGGYGGPRDAGGPGGPRGPARGGPMGDRRPPAKTAGGPRPGGKPGFKTGGGRGGQGGGGQGGGRGGRGGPAPF